MSWASIRRWEYISGIALVIFVVAGIPLLVVLLKENPTCYDNKQNQQELGVDCGGECEKIRLCESQAYGLSVLWSRSFKVTDGLYNSVAYIENPNFDAAIREIAYTFSLYDENNVVVAERRGTTFVSTNAITPIFEAGIETGNRTPVRTFFEFTDTPLWFKTSNIEGLSIKSPAVREGGIRPKIDAMVLNESVDEIEDIEIIATVFDSSNNAFASSRTIIDSLPPRSDTMITFTWPHPFPKNVARIDVVPRIPLDK